MSGESSQQNKTTLTAKTALPMATTLAICAPGKLLEVPWEETIPATLFPRLLRRPRSGATRKRAGLVPGNRGGIGDLVLVSKLHFFPFFFFTSLADGPPNDQ